MRWKLWVIFGVVQCTGLMLFFFTKVPSSSTNTGFLLLGLLLLFPGWLIFFVLMLGVNNLPRWASYLSAGALVVCANALVWSWVVRVSRRKIKLG